jgi:hypothetical protein
VQETITTITEDQQSFLDQLTPDQWQAIQTRLQQRQARKNSKLIDLRFEVDFIFDRLFVVLMVGQDRRSQYRSRSVSKLTKVGNMIAAAAFLITANLLLSAIILLGLYLTKSALGLDFTPGHISESIKKVL